MSFSDKFVSVPKEDFDKAMQMIQDRKNRLILSDRGQNGTHLRWLKDLQDLLTVKTPEQTKQEVDQWSAGI